MKEVLEFKEGGQESLTLFTDTKKTDIVKSNPLVILDSIDWDFKDSQTQYLTHKYHSYPARFIPQIPRIFISLFTKEGDTVLDPFCGCGTTLVESYLLKRNSVGNDFNPLATLLTKVKTTPLSVAQILWAKKVVEDIKTNKQKNPLIPELPNRKISKIFSEQMLYELAKIKYCIDSIENEDEDLHDYLLVALSSTIRAVIESENGDNITGIFERKVKLMNNLMGEFSNFAEKKLNKRVINGDARTLDIPPSSVDLVVTSPPYVNALDYYREHMYNMLWLGMDYKAFKLNEIGGHSHFLQNRFRLLTEYLGDMLRSIIEKNRVLKEGKMCVIVVGNSSIDYELIEGYKFFISMTRNLGFEHKKTIFRNINKSSKSINVGKIDDEYVIVLKKVSGVGVKSSDEEF